MIRLALTGTDTGVGKTLVGTALLAMLRARGLRVSAMKPFDTSLDDDESGSDADVLLAAAGGDDKLELVRPMAIAAPDAPLVTSRQSKVPLDLMKVDDAFAALCDGRDAIVVEGAGGLLGPITSELSFDDLFAAWELDVVIVAPNRMGAINAVRLTERAARTAGLRVRGVVLNAVARDAGVAVRTNRDALAELLPGVPIVTFPWVRSVHDLDQLGRVAERHGLASLLPELPTRDAASFATPMSSAVIATPPHGGAGSSGTARPAAAATSVPATLVSKPAVMPDATAKPAARPVAPRDVAADAKAVVRPAAKADAAPEPNGGARGEAPVMPKGEVKAEPKPVAPRAEVQPAPMTATSKIDRKSESKAAAPQVEAPPGPKSEAKPEPKTVPPKGETKPQTPAKAPLWEPQWELPEPKTDAVDEAFAAAPPPPPPPAPPVAPGRSHPDASRTKRPTPGGTLRHFDEDDPRLPDDDRVSGPGAGRHVNPAPPPSTAPPAPRPPEPRPAPSVDAHPGAVSEDEAAAAMQRLLAARAARSTPPESAPAVPAAPRSDSPTGSPRVAPPGTPSHATPSGGVFRAADGHSFVFAGDSRDVELDEDEVAPLARSGAPVRHGPPPPPPAPRTRGPMRGAPAGAPVLLQPADASDRLARLDPASGRVQMVFLRELPPGAPITPAGEYAMVEDTMICVYRAGDRLFVNIGERRVEITDQIESRIVRGGRRGLRRLLPGAGKPNVFQLLRGRTVVATFSYSADSAALPLMTSALTQHIADEKEWDFLVRLHHILSTPELRRRFPGV